MWQHWTWAGRYRTIIQVVDRKDDKVGSSRLIERLEKMASKRERRRRSKDGMHFGMVSEVPMANRDGANIKQEQGVDSSLPPPPCLSPQPPPTSPLRKENL